jgi:hypothetical protein
MELVAVLLLCAMTALVLYRVVSHPLLPRRPDEHPHAHHPDPPSPGTSQVRRRAF